MQRDIHIAFIGLDGWGSYDLDKSFDHMPHVRHYSKKGIFSDNKMAVRPTISAPNWGSIFMGADPNVHGFFENSKKPSISYDFNIKNNIFPTINQIIIDESPTSEIGLFCQWGGLLYVVDKKSISHICHYPRYIKYVHRILTNKATNYIRASKPLLCTIVFDDPDHIGHTNGYFSPKYYSILEYLDECIEKIVKAYKEVGIYDNTVFIITSDHGGNGKTHGGDSIKELKTPIIMWGKGIRDIGYWENAMEQKDVAAIMAKILDIKAPIQWTGNNHDVFFK